MASPIKPTLKTEIIPLALIVLSLVASFIFYANFPERVPIHWDINNQPNGWGSRGVAAFLFPLINIGLYLLFLGFPYIDPKKNRYQQFASVYHLFKGAIIGFLTLIYFIASLAGLGIALPISTIVMVAVGILFIIIGNYMPQLKPNWFTGIRTPWTLSNEKVWQKTHDLGGKIFVLLGIFLILISFLSGKMLWPLFIIGVLAAAFIPMIYSYFLYREIEKK